jgi:hypothetical protein
MAFEKMAQPQSADSVAQVVYSRRFSKEGGASKLPAPHLWSHLFLKGH